MTYCFSELFCLTLIFTRRDFMFRITKRSFYSFFTTFFRHFSCHLPWVFNTLHKVRSTEAPVYRSMDNVFLFDFHYLSPVWTIALSYKLTQLVKQRQSNTVWHLLARRTLRSQNFSHHRANGTLLIILVIFDGFCQLLRGHLLKVKWKFYT